MQAKNRETAILRLPFDQNVSVRYLESPGYVLGIFRAAGIEDRLTLRMFIQIETGWPGDANDNMKFRLFPYTHLDNWKKADLIELQDMSSDYFDGSCVECREMTIDALKNGRYPVVELDAFFLSFKAEHRQRHFIHKVLIVGVDHRENRFFVVGYGARDWGEHSIAFGEFDRAINASRESLKPGYRRLACWIRSKEEYVRRDLDVSRIIEELKGYLKGVVEDGSGEAQAPRIDRNYGMNARKDYQSYLEALKSDHRNADRRKTRLLMEHSLLMRDRLRFVGKESGNGKVDKVEKLMSTCIRHSRSLHCCVSLLRGGRLSDFDLEKQIESLDAVFMCEAEAISEFV